MEDIVLPNTGRTEIIFDVFVTDPMMVDQFMYRCWLQGLSEEETAIKKLPNIPTALQIHFKNFYPILLSEVRDQFRNFRLMEHHLKNPNSAGSEVIVQITPRAHQMMVESYYEVDDMLMRELIGRKLTNGLRKDLVDVAEKINLKLACCLRQFKNLKRVYRTVDDEGKNAHAIDIIQKNFHISRDLANKYVRLVFMCFHRFDTTKKRLQVLTYSDFDRFSAILMTYWVDPLVTNSIEVDLKLKDDIRDLKAYLFSSKDIPEQFRKLIKAKFAAANPPMSKAKLKQLEGKFKSLLKAILNIGSNISDAKQFKDVFEDLIEKIGDVCAKIELTQKEVDQLFVYMEETFEANILGTLKLRHGPRFAVNWRRYLEGLRGIVVPLYPIM